VSVASKHPLDSPQSHALIEAASRLRTHLAALQFGPPVSHVYQPLDYAWAAHKAYLERYANTPKAVVFVGMNPGPFGMVQTGIPFGEVRAVSEWLGITAPIEKPPLENPKRPIEGFACQRSEVSGRRLWGLFQACFGSAEAFFAHHFVANYCPLAFFDQGRNLTPDTLLAAERRPLEQACDAHLRTLVQVLDARHVVGIGGFAHKAAARALQGMPVHISRILHPSPASPAANRDWAGTVSQQLTQAGLAGFLP
jgi:single-strand selective monofunctional uracil DNA glycosylase